MWTGELLWIGHGDLGQMKITLTEPFFETNKMVYLVFLVTSHHLVE